MGIVAKQSIWNTVTLYLGVLLGGVNTMLLFPLVLYPEQYGLTRVIVTIGILGSQFAMMGMPAVLIKFLHQFRKKEGSSYGLFPFVLMSCIVGVVVVTVAMYFGKSLILKPYSESAGFLSEKYYLLFPLVFFMTMTGVLSNYLKAIFRSVFQLVVGEIFVRIGISIILTLKYFEVIDFDIFLWLFVIVYGCNALLLVFYLVRIKEFDLKRNKEVVNQQNKKQFYRYGFANFLSGIGFRLSNIIDVLMIGAMVVSIGLGSNGGLKAVAIYSLASYISSVIEMPARAIGNIATSLISKAWADNNLNDINSLYKKSSINQLIVGGLVFIGIWVNIDNVILVLNGMSKEGWNYSEIKYVVFFLGLAKLFHVTAGINGGIIVTSKYYLFITYLTVGLIFVTFATNLVFIPTYGIVGAALATAISLLVFNITSFSFLLFKFQLQPFTIKTIITLFIGLGVYFGVSFIPQMGKPLIDIFLRSTIVVFLYAFLIIALSISVEFTTIANKISVKLGFKQMNR